MIRFTLDGRQVTAKPGETIWAVARREGIEIPHLCHLPRPGYRPDGNCRACLVEVAGERSLAASCIRTPREGMEVSTASSRAEAARRMVFELLLADMPPLAPAEQAERPPPPRAARDPHGPFAAWAERLGITRSRFPPEPRPAPDHSHPAIAVALDSCIACGLCERACREVQHNDVIGFTGRGARVEVAFDMLAPLGASSCVGCGECVEACPTGALLPASVVGPDGRRTAPPAPEVASVCPYCGVGCQLGFRVREGRIEEVVGRDGPSNRGRLCVKGRFGFDYVSHPERLVVPLIRIAGAPKDPADCENPSRARGKFRAATWEEALDAAARGLLRIRDRHGPRALAGFGSAKGSNEEAYLFQKLVRTGFGSNNVDHCTRLCHASSVAALLESIGSGAVTAPFTAALESDVILLVGARPEENHPVAATFLKEAARRGAALIIADPRGGRLDRFAEEVLRLRPGSDVALLNGLLHVVLAEGLEDRAFATARLSGLEALRAHVAAWTPERAEAACGVPAGQIRRVARRFATARAALTLWGMGVSQSVHGTDNARALISLALVCGQLGRPGAGLHPLRGQNNVQGASDAGLIPMMLPDYRRTDDEAARAALEALWGASLDAAPGLTVVETLAAAATGDIRGMLIMGENPAMSDPDLAHARASLARLQHLVVQDIFLTETAALADVVLPASAWPEKDGTTTNTNRQIQRGRAAVAPPGEARQDLDILVALGQRLGLGWRYAGPAEVFAEMGQAMPSLANITWQRLEREHSVTIPCPAPDAPGEEILFASGFRTADGRARLVPAGVSDPAEATDGEFPLVLTTGRLLEHWHTGAMSRHASVLESLRPAPEVSASPETLRRAGLREGDRARIVTRHGAVECAARADPSLPEGLIFLPFAYREAAANLLTDARLDPVARIPGFKYSAARLEPAG